MLDRLVKSGKNYDIKINVDIFGRKVLRKISRKENFLQNIVWNQGLENQKHCALLEINLINLFKQYTKDLNIVRKRD